MRYKKGQALFLILFFFLYRFIDCLVVPFFLGVTGSCCGMFSGADSGSECEETPPAGR